MRFAKEEMLVCLGEYCPPIAILHALSSESDTPKAVNSSQFCHSKSAPISHLSFSYSKSKAKALRDGYGSFFFWCISNGILQIFNHITIATRKGIG